MAQVLKGREKTETFVEQIMLMRCDRCGAEAEMSHRGDGLEGWVGCVRLTTLFEPPPIAVLPKLKNGEEQIAPANATHACPKCWAEIEAFARAPVKNGEAA